MGIKKFKRGMFHTQVRYF